MLLERVILIGLSGTGKSCIAPLVAERLGFASVDMDHQLEHVFRRTVPEIFRDAGEDSFRAVERALLARECARSRVVIATGGGAVINEANWAAMRPSSVIVHLSAAPETILARLRGASAHSVSERPLLTGVDPAARLADLWGQRRHLYLRADVTVDTTDRSPAQVVDEIVIAVRDLHALGLVPVTSIGIPTGRSDLYVAPGLLGRVGDLAARRWPDACRAWIVSDDHVLPRWGTQVSDALAASGLHVDSYAVPAGEVSKSLARVGDVLDWMLEGKIDRRDVVVALGGGVVGDLAGFVASVALRGVGLIQIPTSLLAMVDSSVGGKTGVNHPRGKNLIGSFYQPQLVIADPVVLETLPEREMRAGWAEIIKHAMIERSATGADTPVLLERLESGQRSMLDRPAEMAALIRHNIRLKAAVVRADEREAGLRRLLNYGHTLGHAMEAAAYRYLHGEAIGLGLRAAARLACRLGRCPSSLVERQDLLLDDIGLPRCFEGEWSVVRERLASDKKVVQGVLTWILPTGPGLVEVSRDVPLEAVEAVARELGAR